MKFIKYLTREYTLFEHCLILVSLLKNNSSIPGIYYSDVLDVSRRGLIDIYILEQDIKRNTDWVLKMAKRPDFVSKSLSNGLKANKRLSNLPLNLPRRVFNLSDDQVVHELLKLKDKFFAFSGYLDFTHYLGGSGIVLTKREIKQLSAFHESRKKVFMAYFKFLERVLNQVALKSGVRGGSLNYLSFSEVISLLQGDLDPHHAYAMQKERRIHYIARTSNGKERIISNNFDEEYKKILKNVITEKIGQIKGTSVNKGVVKGRVKVITQITKLNKLLPKKIIVTQMTKPEIAPFIKNALAIVTDEGGLLCHAATLAREMNIVAIIGTKVATQVLKDGDLVIVDGNKGIVRKIK